MDLTRLMMCVTTEIAIQIRNSPVIMANVFLSFGVVILITIAGMILTSLLICAGTRIVLPVGEDVLDMLTTGKYLIFVILIQIFKSAVFLQVYSGMVVLRWQG